MVNDPVTFGIRFGAMQKSIQEQLSEQDVDVINCGHFQKDADAIVRLSVRGMLTAKDVNAARARLFKAITKEIDAELRSKT